MERVVEGRHMWSHTETLALIDAWEERYDVLRSQRRTAHVHEDIRLALASLNIDKSIRQIVVKIDNLTQKYRKTKYSGRLNPTWIYYKRLDKFMSYPTRYSRRFDAEEDACNDDSDFAENGKNDQDPCTSAATNGWDDNCDVDSTLPMPGQDLHTYRLELLGIISHQLEVQKQSLAVQEKVIALMTSVLHASGSIQQAPNPKIESG
ncbi:hypothetical protein JTE90_006585 [Oedothorax gibbosus]|uniref:Myb/SANT-like DNA-binding domain-containing protein n=1 Tax=Oedothorax gibbosus TaxID=931172 RepID=A0AAV6VMA0_9ARAC|nr:hypothetical protein JTE90_006585 [Oedothorax gibbosus]